jgi:hypothetical protein
MQKYAGSGFITRTKLAAYMGKSNPRHVDKYLAGLERIGTNYFIPDVVEALLREVSR